MARQPIAEGLFTWPDDDPSLIGGSCLSCGTYTFPVRTGCPNCGATAIESRLLERTGTLWTWTSQGFPPKAPFTGTFFSADPFEPWYVGLVELAGQLRVESILVGCTQDTLRIGMGMRLVLMPFAATASGDEIVTFAFAPDEAHTARGLAAAKETPSA
jgi:uncharacterized OB-fold protein